MNLLIDQAIIHESEWTSTHFSWRLSNLHQIIRPNDLYGHKFLIAISLRNRLFSNEWVRFILEELKTLGGTVYLCLVDTPYFHRFIFNEPDIILRRKRLLGITKQQMEQAQRLTRFSKEFSSYVNIIRWDEIERLIPEGLFIELESAFASKGLVYKSIISQIQLTLASTLSSIERERASVFLLRELPVLAYTYYYLLDGVIDVYPGPQASFFWELERGEFIRELPFFTHIAKNGLSLIYADVRQHKLHGSSCVSG